MADKVTMTHPTTGASFEAEEEAVPSWEAIGWKRPKRTRKKSAETDTEE